MSPEFDSVFIRAGTAGQGIRLSKPVNGRVAVEIVSGAVSTRTSVEERHFRAAVGSLFAAPATVEQAA